MDVGAILNQYGLPLAGFVAFALALGKGILRIGTEVDGREKILVAQWTQERTELLSQITYRETLRQEEKARGDRLETALGSQTAALRDVTEVLKDVEREVVRQPKAAPRRA